MATVNEFACSLCRVLYLQKKRRQYNIDCGDLPCPFSYLNAMALTQTDCEVDDCIKIPLFTEYKEGDIVTINCNISTLDLPEIQCSGPYIINL